MHPNYGGSEWNFWEGAPSRDWDPSAFPIGPYPYGDDARHVPDVVHYFADQADALWRMQNDQRLAAEQRASSGMPVYNAGTAIPAPRPSAAELDAQFSAQIEARLAERRDRREARPWDSSPYGDHGEQRAYLRDAEPRFPKPPTPEPRAAAAPEEPKERVISPGVAVLGGALAFTMAAAAWAMDNGGGSSAETPAKASHAYEVPANFRCDANGIIENTNGTATVQLREAVDPRAITAVTGSSGLVNGTPAPGNATRFTFPSEALHNQTLVVSVAGVACGGAFNLGKPGPGDEQFVTG